MPLTEPRRLPRISGQALDDAAFELEQLQNNYLRERGWNYTCDTPGAYWLWEKEIDGKRWTADAGLAIGMQRRWLDAQEPHQFVRADDEEAPSDGELCMVCGNLRAGWTSWIVSRMS